jgi:outer membrane protein OmpA-like peptidoglycan-associated protein/tetratricopeptide (TPR) repeat protein
MLLWSVTYGYGQKLHRKEADRLYAVGKYHEALESYLKVKKLKKEPGLLIKRGVCYLYTNQPQKCIADMSAAHALKSLDNRRFLYMAEAHHKMSEYSQAAQIYKTYLATLKYNSAEYYRIIHLIKQCGYAANQRHAQQLGYIENLGQSVNTIYDDFAPVQSPNQQDRYYFSSARESTNGGMRNAQGLEDDVVGKYSADMFLVDLKDGKWSSVLPFEPLLNSPKHDVIQDFSSDGSVMYYLKTDDLDYGVLHSDTFDMDRDPTDLPAKAQLPFMAEKGDKDLFVFSDSLIFFSSVHHKSIGGYDLVWSRKVNGVWSTPINLGPEVNTVFNETSIYVTKNGKKIYFSSDRTQSFGGYDLYLSTYDENKKVWNPTINLGLPINSPNNDTEIELSADGLTAMISSDRLDSKGGKDLYISYFKDQVLDQLDFIDIPSFVIDTKVEILTLDSIMIAVDTHMVRDPLIYTKEPELLPQRDFISKPLYFKDNDDVLNTLNQVQIKKLVDILKIYPELKVTLTSHFIPESRGDFDLYFSAKRAERIASILSANGVSPDRIYIVGCGSNFPVASHFINDKPSTLAAKSNQRIDIDLYNMLPHFNIKLIHETPIVADLFRENKWDEFNAANQGVSFRVKYATVNQMLKSEIFNLRQYAIIEKYADKEEYVYSFGNFSSYADARALKTEMSKAEGKLLTVVAYYKGVPMSAEQIQVMKNTNTELQTYLSME